VQTTKDHLGTSFPPAVRLQCPSDYKRALQGRRLSRGVLFVFHTPKTPSPEQTTARLGIIVAKRFAAKAITRNTVKRVVRAWFQQNRVQLPPIDLVVRVHRPIPKSSLTQLRKRLWKELNWHLQQVKRNHA